jgi:hypothetical protein
MKQLSSRAADRVRRGEGRSTETDAKGESASTRWMPALAGTVLLLIGFSRRSPKDLTAGRGPDGCIDAVGMEADSPRPDDLVDRVEQMLRIQLERVHVVREAIMACRKGGIVSLMGVYMRSWMAAAM